MKILYALCLLLMALISGCSTPSQRIEEHGPQFNSYTAAEKRLIRSGEIAVGFDEDQVRMALGEPRHIKSDTRASGTRDIWEYYELEPNYNIFNSISTTVKRGFDAGIGVGGNPAKSKLIKRVVFDRSTQKVSEFQSYE